MPTYQTVATVRASIEQIRGDEALRMGIQDAKVVKRLKIRARDGLNTNMKAVFGTREFHFLTIDELMENGRETWITAEERLRP